MLLRQSMASSTSELRPWSQGPFVFTMVLQGLVNLPSEWLDWWMTGMHYGYTRANSGSPKRREERKEDTNENQEEAKDPGGMERRQTVCTKNSPSLLSVNTHFISLSSWANVGHSLLVTSAFCDRSTQQKEVNQGGLVWIHGFRDGAEKPAPWQFHWLPGSSSRFSGWQ